MFMELNYEQLKAHTAAHRPFITIYRACGGWQSQLLTYSEIEHDDGVVEGIYEPWQTGFGPYSKRSMAIEDARSWAEAEELPYYINGKENTK